MSILKVARMGHPVLRTKADPIPPAEITTPRIQQLIDDMFETMREYSGIGLAAPQVHEKLRLFVAGLRRTDDLPEELASGEDMRFADHSAVELERLQEERRLEQKRAQPR